MMAKNSKPDKSELDKKRTKSESTQAATNSSKRETTNQLKKAVDEAVGHRMAKEGGPACASSRLTRNSDILEVRGESQCSNKSPINVLSVTDGGDSIYPKLLPNSGGRNSVHIIETKGYSKNQNIDLNGSKGSPARVRMPPV